MSPPKSTRAVSVTVKQIARHAGVSLGTVSHVLNGSARVSDALKARVERSVRELGYQPSQLARGLRRRVAHMIGMIIPDIANPFFPLIVRGAEDVASEAGYALVLAHTDNNIAKEGSQIAALMAYQPAGLLIVPASGTRAQSWSLPSTQTPVVCVDRCPAGWQGDTVFAANENGGFQAGQHLIRQGHRRIAIIAGPAGLPTARDRLAGFRRALEEEGQKLPPDYVVRARFDQAGGESAARRLLGLSPRPTAIFAANDLVALGVIMAARALGLRCPADLSVIGFDNLDVGALTDPPLTTVHQAGHGLGAAAARQVLARIAGDQGPAQHLLLPTSLVLRGSVAPPSRA